MTLRSIALTSLALAGSLATLVTEAASVSSTTSSSSPSSIKIPTPSSSASSDSIPISSSSSPFAVLSNLTAALIPFPLPSSSWFSVAFSGDYSHLISLHWWLQYIDTAYQEDPGHVFIEIACIVVIVWLVTKQQEPSAKQEEKLSKREEQELIEEWTPAALAPPLPATYDSTRIVPVVESAANSTVTISGKEFLNFSSYNFLGLANRNEVKEACKETIDKYGVGSCGPRGFYGTFDLHLEVEKALAEYFNYPGCILYSDGISLLASVIPAFAKRGDLVICDEGCNFAIQQGINLSRSNVIYFKHNDMNDLERILDQQAEIDRKQGKKKLNRRFIVVEGIYQYYGDLVPLPDIVRLKTKHKFRVILDDSLAIGVLGSEGRGSINHWGMKSDEIEVFCATMDTSMGTIGGFCCGSEQIVDHQRLSGAGYCFSASSPPYSSKAGIVTLGLMNQHPELGVTVRSKATLMRKLLTNLPGFKIVGDNVSPVIHIRLLHSTGSVLEDLKLFRSMSKNLYDQYQIVVNVPDYIPAERVPIEASLRVLVNALHSEEQIEKTAKAIKKVATAALYQLSGGDK